MPSGIIILGANGCGKTTLCKALARVINCKSMDIEDYYFEKSEIPYTKARSRDECIQLMLSEINNYGSFIISAVDGDFGKEITSMYVLAVFISAPIEIRIERINQRALAQHGERVMQGGDMYEQQKSFVDFVRARSLSCIDTWVKTLECPVIKLDGTKTIAENTYHILENIPVFLREK